MRILRVLFLIILVVSLLQSVPVHSAKPVANKQEQALLDLYYKEGKPIEAAELTRKYLAVNPDSYVAWGLLGWIRLERDGDSPRAYHDFTQGRRAMKKKYGRGWESSWILRGLILSCKVMERHQEAVDLVNIYNRIFKPRKTAGAAWDLMKLGRYNRAIDVINRAISEDDPVQKASALNTLGAIQQNRDEPEKAYATFKRLDDYMKESGQEFSSATYLHNLALSARILGRFEESEKIMLEATRHFNPNTESNPWMSLAYYYIDELRLPEAIDAVKRMQSWAYHSTPLVGYDNWNSRQTATACLLYYCGLTDEALHLARLTAVRQDRSGENSGYTPMHQASSYLFLRQILLDKAERIRERISHAKIVERPGFYYRLAGIRFEAWLNGTRGARIIMSHDGWLSDTLRYWAPNSVINYQGGEITIPQVVGPGVAEAEIRRLLKRKGSKADRERPYLLLNLGMCLVLNGAPGEAVKYLKEAERTMPRQSAVELDQVFSLEALAFRKMGEKASMMRALNYLMNHDPGCIRRFGLALPTVISFRGGSAARLAASMMKRSPRLDISESGFRLEIKQSGTGSMDGFLQNENGSVLCLMHVKPGKDRDDTARAFCEEFHRKAFRPQLDLSQQDINSIEGSTLASQDTRKALRSLFSSTDDPEGEKSK